MKTNLKKIPILDPRKQINSLPKNIINSDTYIFSNSLEFLLPDANLFELTYVCVNANGVLFKGLKVLNYNLTETNKDLLRIDYKVGSLILKRPMFSFSRKLVLVFNQWSLNYFHFLLDVIPKIFYVLNNIKNPIFIFPKNFPTHYLFFLKELGVKKFLFIKNKNVLYTPKVYLIDLIFSPSGVFSKIEVLAFKAWIEKKIGIILESPNKNIYISRNSANFRKVLNENELLKLLNEYNFELVYLENYSIVEQAKLFQQCKTLLSPHGAGLSNMIFMQEGGNIIEMRLSNTIGNNTFFRLSNALNHDYYYLLSEGNSEDFQIADLYIDLNSLKLILQTI